MLGDIYESQKKYDQAVGSYKRALEIDSNNAEVMTSLAVVYLNTNRNEPAKELLISATQIQPDNGTAHQYLGYCYLRLDDVDNAVQSYSRAIEINDNDWEAHRGLGVAYMMMVIDKTNKDEQLKTELKARAVKHWRRSLELNPNQSNRQKLLKFIQTYSE
jgi:tetratricopeptide (TPR) repeat protein